jgi:bacteriorhodopsin
MSTALVRNSLYISLVVQAITGIVGAYGLVLPLSSKDAILQDVLSLEMFVQLVEFVFYVGFLSIPTLMTLTQERYSDWFISTPVMLFTISLYFFYTNFIETGKREEKYRLREFVREHARQIAAIVLLNFLMLLFGYMAELGMMERGTAFVLGTVALCGSFGIIYEYYGKYSEKSRSLFWIMFGLWSMYGMAFLAPPVVKNISYTVLDVFAKNFFGLFLTYNIYQKSVARPLTS